MFWPVMFLVVTHVFQWYDKCEERINSDSVMLTQSYRSYRYSKNAINNATLCRLTTNSTQEQSIYKLLKSKVKKKQKLKLYIFFFLLLLLCVLFQCLFTRSLVKHPGAFDALEFWVLLVKYFIYLEKNSSMGKITHIVD